MKCRIAVFLSLCILFSVTGCRNKKIPVTTESLPSEGISETVEEMETTTSTVPSSEVTTTTTVKETTETSISSAETTNESTETISVIPSESIRETTTSTTVIEETTAAPTATPTTQPTATPEPTATPTPTPEPTAIPTPTPEPEPEPEFDIEYWVQFEKDYVVQCGFELNPAAVHCWDTPLNANARCIYLERDIRGTIDYYASIAEEYDITMIWVWYEDLGGGEYQIYTGYA